MLLAGCVGGFTPPRPSETPVFDPIAFFAGDTQGHARLKVALRAPRAVSVRSRGRVEPDGSLVLDQTIEREGHPAQTRRWRMRRTSPDCYVASLSSAEGPVNVAVFGNLLRLDFREKGLAVHQDILLASDSRSAVNHMTLSKFGFTVATLDERIEKVAD